MKNAKKLKLEDLKVQSFITEVKELHAVHGGQKAQTAAADLCKTDVSQVLYSACRTCGIYCD